MKIEIRYLTIIGFFLCAHAIGMAQVTKNNAPLSAESIITTRNEQAHLFEGRAYKFATLLSQKTSLPIDVMRKKVFFLHFWFASCAPCIREFSGLNKLYDFVKADTNFVFVAFTFENEKTIFEFKQKYGLKYKIVHVTNDECDDLSLIGGFPLNILLNKNITVEKVFMSGNNTEEEATKYLNTEVLTAVKKLLNE